MTAKSANLTPKQLHFCRCVSSGMTLSDSYRESYSTENMKPSTVNREAHSLMALPKITTRVQRLQRHKDRAIVAASLSDRERVLSKLRDLMDTAEGGSAINAQLRAAELLGKSVGLFKEVQVKEKEPRTVEELQAELDAFLEKHLGIKPTSDELSPEDDPESPIH